LFYRNLPIILIAPNVEKHLVAVVFRRVFTGYTGYFCLEFRICCGGVDICGDMYLIEIVGSELVFLFVTDALVIPFLIFAFCFPYGISTGTTVFADMIVGIARTSCPPPGSAYRTDIVFGEIGTVGCDTVVDVRVAGQYLYIAEIR